MLQVLPSQEAQVFPFQNLLGLHAIADLINQFSNFRLSIHINPQSHKSWSIKLSVYISCLQDSSDESTDSNWGKSENIKFEWYKSVNAVLEKTDLGLKLMGLSNCAWSTCRPCSSTILLGMVVLPYSKSACTTCKSWQTPWLLQLKWVGW